MTNISSAQPQDSKAGIFLTAKKSSANASSGLKNEQILKRPTHSRIDPHLVCLLKAQSPAGESYSHLRHVVESLKNAGQGVVVGITSPGPGEGKTLTAINLAGALAKNPRANVLLLDLDLRQPVRGIKEYLNLKLYSGPGIVDLIIDNAVIGGQIVHFIPEFNLHLTLPGMQADLPYEILKSPKLQEFIKAARQQYDFVIIDTTHVNLLPDTHLLSEFIDGFIVITRADTTSRHALEETLTSMTPDKVLGLLFNANPAI